MRREEYLKEWKETQKKKEFLQRVGKVLDRLVLSSKSKKRGSSEKDVRGQECIYYQAQF